MAYCSESSLQAWNCRKRSFKNEVLRAKDSVVNKINACRLGQALFVDVSRGQIKIHF